MIVGNLSISLPVDLVLYVCERLRFVTVTLVWREIQRAAVFLNWSSWQALLYSHPSSSRDFVMIPSFWTASIRSTVDYLQRC